MEKKMSRFASYGVTAEAEAALRKAGYLIVPGQPTENMLGDAVPEDALGVWSTMIATWERETMREVA